MDYTQVTFRTSGCEDYAADLLAAELAEIGFDCFEETTQGIVGYCPSAVFDEQKMRQAVGRIEVADPTKIAYRVETIADRNWNEVWEQNGYEPIEIDDRCIIHASGHCVRQGYKYELVINPVQSFGTGYHQTTRMILRWILDHKMEGLRVLDMGCGTAVLGILASKRGAAAVTAIDIDKWAWQNAKDNCNTNGIDNAEVLLGDANLLDDSRRQSYDLVFANINRNILLADMDKYAAVMKTGASILMSGYYIDDLPLISEAAGRCGLSLVSHTSDEEWCAAEFCKRQ